MDGTCGAPSSTCTKFTITSLTASQVTFDLRLKNLKNPGLVYSISPQQFQVTISCPPTTISDTIATNSTLTGGPVNIILTDPPVQERIYFDPFCLPLACCQNAAYTTNVTAETGTPKLDTALGKYYVEVSTAAMKTFSFKV